MPTPQIQDIESYWDTRPCNVNHSAYSIGSYSYAFEVRERRYMVESHIPDFARFPDWDGKRVLEVGCGIGTDALSFAKHGAFVTAVDLSLESLNIARSCIFSLGLGVGDRIALGWADAERLSKSLKVQTYDLIYSFGVLHHTPHPHLALREFRKYMHDGSLLKVMLYHRHSWRVLQILALTWRAGGTLDEKIARLSEAQADCPLTRTYTRQTAKRLLESEGFEVLDLHVDFIFPYRVSDYIAHRYVKTWYWRLTPPKLFRFLKRQFGWHILVTARKAKL